MEQVVASTIGGLAGAAMSSVTMAVGRRAGLLHKTLAEHAEDWLDRTMQSRRRVGPIGTTVAELLNHFAAGATFGAAYGAARRRAPQGSDALAGAALGTALYLVTIVGCGAADQVDSRRVERTGGGCGAAVGDARAVRCGYGNGGGGSRGTAVKVPLSAYGLWRRYCARLLWRLNSVLSGSGLGRPSNHKQAGAF